MWLLMVSHYCRECLLCKKPFWTLPAQDPRGRSLRECGSWSWKQEVDPVLIKCNPCPSRGFPLPHPRLSVQTSALWAEDVISAPVLLCPDNYTSSWAMPLPLAPAPLQEVQCTHMADLLATLLWRLYWPLSAVEIPLSCGRPSSRDCVPEQTSSPTWSITQLKCVLSDRSAVSHLQQLLFSSLWPAVPSSLSCTMVSLISAVMEISRVCHLLTWF